MVSVMYPCMFCVALSKDLFVLCVCELFVETIHNMFGCVCYFVVECDGVVECAWRSSIGYTIKCVCCACVPSEHLYAPSICFVCVFVCLKFRSLRAGSQVFALLMLFLCVILHTMSSGKSLQLLCIFPFGMLCLSAISMMFVKIMLAVCILVGMVIRANADSVFSMNCVQSAFL